MKLYYIVKTIELVRMYILLLEFACQVMHEFPLSSHNILNIQFENCHLLTDVQWLMYVGWEPIIAQTR